MFQEGGGGSGQGAAQRWSMFQEGGGVVPGRGGPTVVNVSGGGPGPGRGQPSGGRCFRRGGRGPGSGEGDGPVGTATGRQPAASRCRRGPTHCSPSSRSLFVPAPSDKLQKSLPIMNQIRLINRSGTVSFIAVLSLMLFMAGMRSILVVDLFIAEYD